MGLPDVKAVNLKSSAWQAEHERGPLGQFAPGFDGPIVKKNQMLHNSEPQPRTPFDAVSIRFDAIKSFKNTMQVFTRNSGTIVFNRIKPMNGVAGLTDGNRRSFI